MDHGADINMRGIDDWTVLHKAADCGYYDIAELLLRRGASIDTESAKELTALHYAAGRGHTGTVKLLLNYGANIDAVIRDGWSPFHGACGSGQEGIVRLLLGCGTDINLRSLDGRMPLYRACRGGYTTTAGIPMGTFLYIEQLREIIMLSSNDCCNGILSSFSWLICQAEQHERRHRLVAFIRKKIS